MNNLHENCINIFKYNSPGRFEEITFRAKENINIIRDY